jgi:lysophospholipase L1-like esterase
MLAAVLLFVLLAFWLLLRSWRNAGWLSALGENLARLFERKIVIIPVVLVFSLALLVISHTGQAFDLLVASPYQAAVERIMPIFSLVSVLVSLTFVLIVLLGLVPHLQGTARWVAGAREAWRNTPRKEKYFAIITTVFVAVFLFAIMEITLRLLRPQPTYSYLQESVGEQYAPSDFIPFTLKPNYEEKSPSQEFPGEQVTITTNSLGLRGAEVSLEKPAGVKRVLVLGDSYTFGVYVEDDETYSAVLESLFREEGAQVEVINAGYADGWEPDEHYAWLVNRGLEFEPDLVIYGFFVGNDISGLFPEYWSELDARGLPTRIDDPNYYVDTFGRLRSRAKDRYAVGFDLIYRVPVLRESHLAIFLNSIIHDLLTRLTPKYERSEYGHFPFILRESSDELMLEQEKLFLDLVAGMDAVAGEHGAEFMVLMIPVNFQVEPDFLAMVYGPKYKVERNYYEEVKPVFDEMDVLYLDVLEEMTAIPGQYFPRNGEVHFNPAGHRFAAEQLKSFLDENGLP